MNPLLKYPTRLLTTASVTSVGGLVTWPGLVDLARLRVRDNQASNQSGKIKQVKTKAAAEQESARTDQDGVNPLSPFNFLFSSSDEETAVNTVRVDDKGSVSQCDKVLLQGVPVSSIVELTFPWWFSFLALLSYGNLTSRNQTRRPGRMTISPLLWMALDVCFEDKKMRTPIYVKMDAHDQLLVSADGWESSRTTSPWSDGEVARHIEQQPIRRHHTSVLEEGGTKGYSTHSASQFGSIRILPSPSGKDGGREDGPCRMPRRTSAV